jgi:1-acyl-sn-glycerol-3-phosphate acyltransferase
MTASLRDERPSKTAREPKRLRSDDLDYRDPEYIERTLGFYLAIGRNYFRSEVRGWENIPEGGAVLVGNHSGGFHIMDAIIFVTEFYAHFGAQRPFHQLIHDVVAHLPGFEIVRKFGSVTASRGNGEAALARGVPLLVYPGGDYETFRPSWHSNRIEFGGRKGFTKLALAADVPIVPVVAIGGQETALFLTRGERLARWLGFDRKYRLCSLSISLGFPFGLSVLDFPPRIPLPAKITIQVLPPIDLRRTFGSDPDPQAIYDHVTGEMQKALDLLAAERRFPVLG